MNRNQMKWLDHAFGLWMRRNFRACGMCGGPLDDTAQVSHIYGRANLSVRWDPRNCDLVHDRCHREWERYDRSQRNEQIVRKLGRDGAMALSLDSTKAKKWTAAELAALAALIYKYSL